MRILFKKKQHGIALKIIANYLIAKDALITADKDGSEFMDAIEHLTDNTVNALVDLVGIKGLKYYTNKYNLGVSGL